MHRTSRSSVMMLAILAGVVVRGDPAGSRKPGGRPPCPPARYLLSGPLLPGAAGTAVMAGPAGIVIEGVCDEGAPLVFKGTRKGTRVKARWDACPGLAGTVRLAGLIVDACGRFEGRVNARRFKRRVQAVRSDCGDGIVDRGGGEECDPPEAGACDPGCRETVTAAVGADGGTVTSLDGGLTLAIPAAALTGDTAITIRRLDPDKLPPVAKDLGAVAAYELGPDGLQFALPVTATFQLGPPTRAADGSVSGGLAVLLSLTAGADDTEILADQTTVIDGDADVVTASASVTHFSTVFVPLLIGRRELGEVQVTLPNQVGVAVPFEVVVGVRVRHDNVDDEGAGTITVTHEDDPAGRALLAYAGPASVPISGIPNNAPVVKAIPGYSCTAPGPGTYGGRITGRAFFQGVRAGGTSTEVPFTLRLAHTTQCVGAAPPPPGSSTTTTTTTSTTTTSTTTSTSTTTTSSTSTSPTTSTTTTTTIPCALIQPAPDPATNPFPDPVCSGNCPPTDVCVFSPDAGTCSCQPVGALCSDGDPDPQNAVCGGLCQNPDATCALQQDAAGNPTGCGCLDPCLAVRPRPTEANPNPSFECVEVGECPPGKACDLETCRCVPGSTSTSTSSTTTSTAPPPTTSTSTVPTTTTSSSTTTTSTSTTSTSTLPGDTCGVDESQSPPVCGGDCSNPEERCLTLEGTIVCTCTRGCALNEAGSCGGGCETVGEVCALTPDGGCRCVSGEACRERPELATYVEESHSQPAGICGGLCPDPGEVCRPVGGSAAHTCACLMPEGRPCTLVADDPENPVCAGECGNGGICVDTGAPGEPSCQCQPLAATCAPGPDGVCGGLCPRAGEVCAASELGGGDCACTRFPCRNEGVPGGPVVCGGACPDPSDDCRQPPDGGDCGCFSRDATTTTTSSTSTTTSSTSTTIAPALALQRGYRHLQPGASVVCLHVSTTPPSPGAAGSASLSGPGGSQSTEFVTGADGGASIQFPINLLGSHGLFVQMSGGRSAGTTLFVGPTQGTCPAPPALCNGTVGQCTDGCASGQVCCPLLGPGVCACQPEQLVDVIEVGGKCLPVSQLVPVTGPECVDGGGTQLPHWHARSGYAIATDGTIVEDTEDCGYALVDQTPLERREHCAPCGD